MLFFCVPEFVVYYRYAWGEVTLRHSGNTFIRLEFAGRRQAAKVAFARANTRENWAAVQRFKSRL